MRAAGLDFQNSNLELQNSRLTRVVTFTGAQNWISPTGPSIPGSAGCSIQMDYHHLEGASMSGRIYMTEETRCE